MILTHLAVTVSRLISLGRQEATQRNMDQMFPVSFSQIHRFSEVLDRAGFCFLLQRAPYPKDPVQHLQGGKHFPLQALPRGGAHLGLKAFQPDDMLVG